MGLLGLGHAMVAACQFQSLAKQQPMYSLKDLPFLFW
jgi:hypothetical protein